MFFNLKNKHIVCMLLVGIFVVAGPGVIWSLDTDIYQANVKQNAYVLMDNSGSMAFGVYESNIDYAAMYDYLYAKDNIDDTIANPDFYKRHNDRNKLYLLKGKIGVTVKEVDGETKVFTGDAADPDYLWYTNDLVDMHVYIDSNGDLVPEDGKTPRVTVDADGYILLDGVRLPLGQSRLHHDVSTMYDGSTVDKGFGGLMRAPGYCFSGLEGVGASAADHNEVEDGDQYIYFFITGNWINMQQMYNLHYISNPPGAPATGDPAWQYETFPIGEGEWSVIDHEVDYPEGDINYENNLSETVTETSITHPGASEIQVHFSVFDVEGDGKSGKFQYDYVVLYDGGGNLIARYDNDNNPKGTWSPTITGDTVRICLKSDSGVTGAGYTIDKIRITYIAGSYLMQNRLDIAKDAMLYVVDEMRGKINWGFASFNYNGTTANGATIHSALNPNENDDTNRAAIARHVQNVSPMYGTPLGEALQDVFEDGYYGHRHSLDNLLCRKNYAIVVSDGFPSGDDDWKRIGGKTFTDEDGDGFTADPYQYKDPPPNYYDDVAHWMYTHSWLDKSKVEDPASSYVNVVSHQIAFGMDHPLLEDAADEAGGEYITAYNKTQLVNAFYSLALMISESISFTAPVVSVDAENKIQNGDDLYMGLFLPMDASYWPGNLKKFKLGDGSEERPDFWMIYDADNVPALDADGRFLDNTADFWADDDDANDSDNYGGPDIQEDGAGEVLTERVAADFKNKNYYERNIKTYLSGKVVGFDQGNVSPTDLGLAITDTDIRNKVVNWVYGYTFEADAASGAPLAPRDWALGAIVHSRPVVVDYYNGDDFTVIDKRYVVVGANDGMLHVFDDSPGAHGEELFAFVPPDVLSKLPAYETQLNQPLVDGSIKLYRLNGDPKYLVFGLRRGGAGYWALDIGSTDVSKWKVAWSFAPSEIAQSWSDIELAKIRTGENAFKDVAIITGGYDPVEDSFPEPFNDTDNNGTPFAASGQIDNQEWSASDSEQDVYNNNSYDVTNPVGDDYGRGIYVLDVDDGSVVFSVTNGEKNLPSILGTASKETRQTRKDFKYCFPASPSVVTTTLKYSYESGGEVLTDRANNVLAAIYAIDIYGNVFRVTHVYAGGGTGTWQVKHVFSANPGSKSGSGAFGAGDNGEDGGRKVFYGPAVSWQGAGHFFDPGNYFYDTNTTFYGKNGIASIFFGTGDREHPSYQMVKERVYAIYDDTPVTAIPSVGSELSISSAPYTEDDLLNLTCDELGTDTSYSQKSALKTLLTDDVLNETADDPMEKNGSPENDAKGWYIVLEEQGAADYCEDCSYVSTLDLDEGGEDYHIGEKVMGKLTLFAGILLFTTYQPSYDDPCTPQGNAFLYALNYLNGAAALNLNLYNDDTNGTSDDKVRKDLTDRYGKYGNVKGIPSSPTVVIRNGDGAVMASAGGKVLILPGLGKGKLLDLLYWIEE